MKVINLFGGAGAGKSTMAASLFAHFRFQNRYNCELVPEFAKEVVYEGNRRNLGDQLYLFGNQEHKLSNMKREGIKIAIVDSPLLMALCYAHVQGYQEMAALTTIVTAVAHQYGNLNVYIRRPDEGNFRKNKKWSYQIDDAIKILIPLDHSIRFDVQGSVQLNAVATRFIEEGTDAS